MNRLTMKPGVIDGGTGRVIAFAVMFERTIVDEQGHSVSVFIGTTAQQRARDVMQPHTKRTAFTAAQIRDIADRLTVDGEGFTQDSTHYATTVEDHRGGVKHVAGPAQPKGVQ